MFDLAVIGAGPAGMTAAITAARNNKKVCLIEHNDRPGKKILVTGNGKCNITNLDMTPLHYRSDSKETCFGVINKFGPAELIEFLKTIGLITTEKNGYIYPFSGQASSVSDALRNEVSRLRIDLMTLTNTRKISPSFVIETDKGIIKADSLIIACGSKCAAHTGSDGSGYEFAKMLGHSIIEPVPALVQVRCREGFLKKTAGVRVNASVNLKEDNEIIESEYGEVQFTDYGISGIPVFQISRYIQKGLNRKRNIKITINFMPDHTAEDIFGIISSLFSFNGRIDYVSALNGLFNRKLASVILENSGVDKGRPCREADRNIINSVCRNITDFTVTPISNNGFENAQVCAGGVNLDEIDLDTMESRLVNGLYFAGEILDVDGKCGGYNLQWAFSSGWLAGCLRGHGNDKNQPD